MELGALLSKVVLVDSQLLLASWGFRQKYEIEYRLSRSGGYIRWLLVSASQGLMLWPPSFLRAHWEIRFLLFLLGVVFLVWPNLILHIANAMGLGSLVQRSGSSGGA